MARRPSEAINPRALRAQSHSRLVKPSTHVPEALGPLTPTHVINKHCQNGDVFACQTWRNNSRKNPRISKGGRKDPLENREQGICWCWHVLSLHFPAKTSDPIEHVVACVW